MYQTEMSEPGSIICKDYFSKAQQQSIVSIYLKGITIKDLALQFNCTTQIITQVLLNNHIEIVDQEQPRRREAKTIRNKRKY